MADPTTQSLACAGVALILGIAFGRLWGAHVQTEDILKIVTAQRRPDNDGLGETAMLAKRLNDHRLTMKRAVVALSVPGAHPQYMHRSEVVTMMARVLEGAELCRAEEDRQDAAEEET